MNPTRYAPPRADVQDVHGNQFTARISDLPVSNNWKSKFHLLEKAGGPKMPELKALAFGERMKITLNFLAFLFGPIYYIVKGMWRKGLALFAACVLAIVGVAFLLELVGLGRFINALGYGAAASCAVRANIDYYKKMVLGQNGWW